MAPKYTLHYFNKRARAEMIRWIFAAAGVEYEDKRYSDEEWADFKPKTPFGQLPILEVEGRMLCQTNAIVLHLANEFHLGGDKVGEVAMILGCMDDAIEPLVEAIVSHDGSEEQALLMKKFAGEGLPKLLSFLSAQIGDGKWLVGEKMTVADICIARMVSELPPDAAKMVKLHSGVQAMIDRVFALQRIRNWLATRPETAK